MTHQLSPRTSSSPAVGGLGTSMTVALTPFENQCPSMPSTAVNLVNAAPACGCVRRESTMRPQNALGACTCGNTGESAVRNTSAAPACHTSCSTSTSTAPPPASSSRRVAMTAARARKCAPLPACPGSTPSSSCVFQVTTWSWGGPCCGPPPRCCCGASLRRASSSWKRVSAVRATSRDHSGTASGGDGEEGELGCCFDEADEDDHVHPGQPKHVLSPRLCCCASCGASSSLRAPLWCVFSSCCSRARASSDTAAGSSCARAPSAVVMLPPAFSPNVRGPRACVCGKKRVSFGLFFGGKKKKETCLGKTNQFFLIFWLGSNDTPPLRATLSCVVRRQLSPSQQFLHFVSFFRPCTVEPNVETR
jgi:hypothetical protein